MWSLTKTQIVKMHRSTIRRTRGHTFETLDVRALFAIDLAGALSFGGVTGSNHAFDVVTDSVGNSYVAGHFSGTADFDQAASYLDAHDIADKFDPVVSKPPWATGKTERP